MPGLFGVVCIDPRRQSTPESLHALLDRMAGSLRHYEGYVTRTWVDAGDGLAVGRIGLPHQDTIAWPDDAVPARTGVRSFFAGRWYGEGVATDPDGDPSWERYRQRVCAGSGSFSAVLRSDAAAETVVAVDRQGSQPIFYTVHDGLLFFAPEVKALLAVPSVDKTLDWAALATFLACGYPFSEQSFFTAIRRLPGGTAITVTDGKPDVRPYWRFEPGADELDRPMEELAEEVGGRIDAAVARDLDDPAKTVLLLSGGVDSRAILGAAYHALRRDGQRIHAVTWGCAHGRPGADVEISRRMGRALALRHEVIETDMAGFTDYAAAFRRVNYLLDGMSAAAAIHPDKFVITEALYARGYRILLRGEQTFGFAEREYGTAGVLNKLGVRRFGEVDLLLQLAHPELRAALTAGSDRIVDDLIRAGERLDPNDFTHRAYFNDRYQRLSGATAYYKQVLMDHRSPLMDNALLDIIQRLPQTCRDDKALLYYIVKTRYPELAGFDYASRTNLEDWAGLFAADTPVRRHALAEFSDASSGLWNVLNRDLACRLLTQAASYRPAPPRNTPLKDTFKRLRPALYKTWPRLAARMRLARGKRQGMPPYVAILRILVLKNWYDTFVRG